MPRPLSQGADLRRAEKDFMSAQADDCPSVASVRGRCRVLSKDVCGLLELCKWPKETFPLEPLEWVHLGTAQTGVPRGIGTLGLIRSNI